MSMLQACASNTRLRSYVRALCYKNCTIIVRTNNCFASFTASQSFNDTNDAKSMGCLGWALGQNIWIAADLSTCFDLIDPSDLLPYAQLSADTAAYMPVL